MARGLACCPGFGTDTPGHLGHTSCTTTSSLDEGGGARGAKIRSAPRRSPPSCLRSPPERLNDHPSGRTTRRPSITQRRARAPLSAPKRCAAPGLRHPHAGPALPRHPRTRSRGHPDRPRPTRSGPCPPTRPRAELRDVAPCGSSRPPPRQRLLPPQGVNGPSSEPETPPSCDQAPHGAAAKLEARARSAAMNETASGQKLSTSTCMIRWKSDRCR